MMKLIKQLFCKHEYEAKRIYGFLIVDGNFVRPMVEECKKCGKQGKWWY